MSKRKTVPKPSASTCVRTTPRSGHRTFTIWPPIGNNRAEMLFGLNLFYYSLWDPAGSVTKHQYLQDTPVSPASYCAIPLRGKDQQLPRLSLLPDSAVLQKDTTDFNFAFSMARDVCHEKPLHLYTSSIYHYIQFAGCRSKVICNFLNSVSGLIPRMCLCGRERCVPISGLSATMTECTC